MHKCTCDAPAQADKSCKSGGPLCLKLVLSRALEILQCTLHRHCSRSWSGGLLCRLRQYGCFAWAWMAAGCAYSLHQSQETHSTLASISTANSAASSAQLKAKNRVKFAVPKSSTPHWQCFPAKSTTYGGCNRVASSGVKAARCIAPFPW